MPGNATIDPNVFIDSLISIVDDVRDMATDFGCHQFKVDLVTMTPVPRRAGGPHNTVKVITTIDPTPKVKPYKLTNDMEPCGIDEADLVLVEHVSLTYTEPELTGKNLDCEQEFYWRLTDAHGQETFERYFTLAKPPFPRRGCKMDWQVTLKRAEAPI